MPANTPQYGQAYYQSYLGVGEEIPYERNDHWPSFFGGIADQIVQRLQPTTVLDAGCALGFLVEALRHRGVEAEGLDASSYAIGQAHESVAEHVRLGTLTEPIQGHFDLVTCIEVIEHLPAGDAPTALKNITAVSDRLLLSTSPDDFAEATHLNVQPPEYWACLLADLGFTRVHDFDASFITPWAALYERTDARLAQLVTSYERERWRLVQERDALRGAVIDFTNRAGQEDQPTEPSPRPEIEQLRHDLRTAIDAAHAADARRASVESRLAHVEFALDVAKAREEQVEDLLDQINERAGGDIAGLIAENRELQELTESRSFKLIWRLLTPYRRVRGGR